MPTTFNFSVFKLTVPLFVPSVTPRFVDKLATASLAIVLTSPMLATLLLSALLFATIPVPTLVIALLPALIPAALSIDKPPTVTLSVVTLVPVIAVVPLVNPDVLITVLPAVTESNVRSFFVLTVIFLPSIPSCVISMLSPLMRSTVLPPDTLVAVPPLVEIFHAEPSLADVTALVMASFTTVFMLSAVTTPSVVLLSVPSAFVVNVPFLTVTFTVSAVALVDTKSLSPATLNARPPDLLSACAVVSVESAFNVNVLLPNVDTEAVASVIFLLNAVLALLIADATSAALATPAVAVVVPSVLLVNVPSATLTVIV